MNVARLRRARELFYVEGVPRHIARHNMRQWVRSLRYLGDRWLFARSIQRKYDHLTRA